MSTPYFGSDAMIADIVLWLSQHNDIIGGAARSAACMAALFPDPSQLTAAQQAQFKTRMLKEELNYHFYYKPVMASRVTWTREQILSFRNDVLQSEDETPEPVPLELVGRRPSKPLETILSTSTRVTARQIQQTKQS
jgi:hypothetical protein